MTAASHSLIWGGYSARHRQSARGHAITVALKMAGNPDAAGFIGRSRCRGPIEETLYERLPALIAHLVPN
jgi:hypothetical protein